MPAQKPSTNPRLTASAETSIRKSHRKPTGSLDQYSLGTVKSTVPSINSGRCNLSVRTPAWSVGAKYSPGVSLGYVHMLQTNLFPPPTNCMKGLMYARHLRHRGGPASPKSITGIGCSPSCRGARGCSTSPSGRAVAASASFDIGMLFIVNLAYLGDELPWSNATKGTVAGGGR